MLICLVLDEPFLVDNYILKVENNFKSDLDGIDKLFPNWFFPTRLISFYTILVAGPMLFLGLCGGLAAWALFTYPLMLSSLFGP